MAQVTVIIPCYNASQYIDKCIESLARQTYSSYKVILVDDKSTDDTYQHLLHIKSVRDIDITVIQNKVNCGPAASRNNGILLSNTKYIAFCDSDDWYDDDFLEKMVNLLEQNEADIAFCGYKVVDEKGKIETRPVYGNTGAISREEAFSLDADSLCMLMIRSEIMKDTLLPNLRNGEDVATVPMLVLKSNKFVVTRECLYNYFRRSNSASELPSMRVVDSLISSFDYVKTSFPPSLGVELEYLGIKNVLYGAMIVLFSICYNKKMADEILSKFETEFPNWKNNPYRGNMRFYKRMIVSLISFRWFRLVRIIALIRNRVLK